MYTCKSQFIYTPQTVIVDVDAELRFPSGQHETTGTGDDNVPYTVRVGVVNYEGVGLIVYGWIERTSQINGRDTNGKGARPN